jgi:hypothetical protein
MVKIGIAADHAGFLQKEMLKKNGWKKKISR